MQVRIPPLALLVLRTTTGGTWSDAFFSNREGLGTDEKASGVVPDLFLGMAMPVGTEHCASQEFRPQMAYTVSFEQLWAYHPATQDPPVVNPCERSPGVPAYDHQCAIRLSTCFDDCGVSLVSYGGFTCHLPGHGRAHIRSAEGLAVWLNGKRAPFGKAQIVRNNQRRTAIQSQQFGTRQGIVLFRNFWGTNNQGDHIDLWDGEMMTYGQPGYFARAQEVWFWDIY